MALRPASRLESLLACVALLVCGTSLRAQHDTELAATPGAGLHPAGASLFGAPALIDQPSGSRGMALFDMDRDGDVDVLSINRLLVSFPLRLSAHRNQLGGSGQFARPQTVDSGGVILSVHGADLDGDQADDVLVTFNDGSVGAAHSLLWFKNTDGLGSFGPPQVVSAQTLNADTAVTGDLDGDGDADLLTGAYSPIGHLAWYRNADGLGTFGPPSFFAIAPDAEARTSITTPDIDGDGDADALFISGLHEISWSENVHGTGDFGPKLVLATDALNLRAVVPADVDGDGDCDVLAACPGDDTLAWYENTNGSGAFGPRRVVWKGDSGLSAVQAADVDLDGELDAVSAWPVSDEIAWHENTDGLGVAWAPPMFTPGADSPQQLRVADLDLDGDVDVLYQGGENPSLQSDLAWIENLVVSAPWTHLGGASVGVAGPPGLRPDGPLTPGSSLTLSLERAPPGALMLAWLSFTSTPLEVLGGTLHANPFDAQLLAVSDAEGEWSQALTWPTGIPGGTDFWLQVLVQDPSVPGQITLSNGLRATPP